MSVLTNQKTVYLFLRAPAFLLQVNPTAAQTDPLYKDPVQLRYFRSRMTADQKAPDIERSNIKPDRRNQSLHGVVRTKPATMPPVSIGSAATGSFGDIRLKSQFKV